MTIQAASNGVVIARSDDTILVEGNHYFPLSDVDPRYLQPSDATSHCPWKGDARYYHVVVDGDRREDAAWYYPAPYAAAASIENYVAFWKGVEVSGANADEPEIAPPPRHA